MLFLYIVKEMSKTILKFGNIEIERYVSHNKHPVDTDKVDVENSNI